MTTQQCYTLKEARKILGLSKRDLARLSGISIGVIRRIESKTDIYKTHYGVAEALADALGMETNEINWPRGLSHLGRPPKTGKPITVRRTLSVTITDEVMIESDQPLCSKHFIVLPKSGICDRCS